ncbi:hypothetical protein ACODT5_19575 [Streptomyces sp. 5.8]|uniref:hypothetical protein n=1 Tax=Streptomyces sp. 5.8 TaxID=3406571 RepID=UPI003BB5BCC2
MSSTSTSRRRLRRLAIATSALAAAGAGILVPTLFSGLGQAHAAPNTCDGVTGELVKQSTSEWYSSTCIKIVNHSEAEKPFTLKVQLPGDARFENNRAGITQEVVEGNEVTVTGSLKAGESLPEYGFGLHNTLSEAHHHLHPVGEITLNGAPLGACTESDGAGSAEEASAELTAKTWSKKDKVDLYFADLSIPTGGAPSDRYEIHVNGKLAATAIFGDSRLSKDGVPVKQLKQVLPLGTGAGVTYKVKVRPVGHHTGEFTNEVTITSGK